MNFFEAAAFSRIRKIQVLSKVFYVDVPIVRDVLHQL